MDVLKKSVFIDVQCKFSVVAWEDRKKCNKRDLLYWQQYQFKKVFPFICFFAEGRTKVRKVLFIEKEIIIKFLLLLKKKHFACFHSKIKSFPHPAFLSSPTHNHANASSVLHENSH